MTETDNAVAATKDNAYVHYIRRSGVYFVEVLVAIDKADAMRMVGCRSEEQFDLNWSKLTSKRLNRGIYRLSEAEDVTVPRPRKKRKQPKPSTGNGALQGETVAIEGQMAGGAKPQ